MDISQARQKLYNLIKKEALVKKKVVLASGKESSVYLDIRKVSLAAEGSVLIAQLMWEQIKDAACTAIGGPTIGADPIVGAVLYHSQREGRPLQGFIIRSAQKRHGMMNLVEGPSLAKGSSAVLVDDVVTTGGSLKAAIDILEKEGVRIEKILAVIDREEEKKFDPEKYAFSALFELSDFIDR